MQDVRGVVQAPPDHERIGSRRPRSVSVTTASQKASLITVWQVLFNTWELINKQANKRHLVCFGCLSAGVFISFSTQGDGQVQQQLLSKAYYCGNASVSSRYQLTATVDNVLLLLLLHSVS
jgi:hypothetical protein